MKEDQTNVVVEKDWLEEAAEVGKNCLIEKFVLNKRVNIKTMKIILCNV